MIEYRHILNAGGDDLIIEEPIGFDDLQISLKRDDKLHGMTFEASTSTLQFFGEAANFLRDQKKANGVLSSVTYQALAKCEGQDDYEEVLFGRLNFGKYKESCGDSCLVSIPWEEESCKIILNSRFDQKVDLDKNISFDNHTPLNEYPGLGVEIELPAKNSREALDGSVAEGGSNPDIPEFAQTGSGDIHSGVRPTYDIQRFNSIDTGNLIPINDVTFDNSDFSQPMTPQLLFENTINCLSGDMVMTARIKGSINVILESVFDGYINSIEVRLVKWDATGSFFDADIIDSQVIFTGSSTNVSQSFDRSYNIPSLTLQEGEGLYNYIYIKSNLEIFTIAGTTIDVTFDPETFINIVANKACPPTTAKTYLVHESLSRVIEAVTEGCIRVKSEFYGRTDSLPFAFPTDGCGGLRTLTSGLYIRKAEEPKFFASPKELIDGLWAIDNIGIGTEPDPIIPGRFVLRVEGVEYFYQDVELLEMDGVPKAEKETEETRHYSKIEVGYSEWEPESINGLDEINSTREYRTRINNLNSTLTIVSNLITGSYLIENTRQQSFAESGGADTDRDNDIFLIVLKRDDGLKVEQGNVTNPEGMYSPETLFNYRISPIRNLMRWYKSILPSLPNFSNIAELMFNSGTGNFTAKGEMTATDCKQENKAVAENESVYTTIYNSQDHFLPIWENERINIPEYPLSLADYKKIKNNPYGYISFQCGDGEYEKGFIVEMKYTIATGKASFTLRKKYN